MNTNNRLVLRYTQGSFSITRLNPITTDEGLWELAQGINSLQNENATQIEVVERVLLI